MDKELLASLGPTNEDNLTWYAITSFWYHGPERVHRPNLLLPDPSNLCLWFCLPIIVIKTEYQ